MEQQTTHVKLLKRSPLYRRHAGSSYQYVLHDRISRVPRQPQYVHAAWQARKSLTEDMADGLDCCEDSIISSDGRGFGRQFQPRCTSTVAIPVSLMASRAAAILCMPDSCLKIQLSSTGCWVTCSTSSVLRGSLLVCFLLLLPPDHSLVRRRRRAVVSAQLAVVANSPSQIHC